MIKITLTIIICIVVFVISLFYFVKGDDGEFAFTKHSIIMFACLCIAPCFLVPSISIYLLPLGALQLFFGSAIIANLKQRAKHTKMDEK